MEFKNSEQSLESLMKKGRDFSTHITLCDFVSAASLGTATFLDYGWWPIIFGYYSLSSSKNFIKRKEVAKSIYDTTLSASLGLFFVSSSIGSALTGDPKNAVIFSSAGVGVLSRLIGDYLSEKSEKNGGLYNKLKNPKEKIDSLVEKNFPTLKKLNPLKYKYLPQLKSLITKNEQPKLKKVNKSKLEKIWDITKVSLSYGITISLLPLYSWILYQNKDTFKGYFENPIKNVSVEVKEDNQIFAYLENSKELNKALKEQETEKINMLLPKNKKLKGPVEDIFEDIIEADLTNEIGEKVNISAKIKDQKSLLVLSSKYSLGQINYNPIPFLNHWMYNHLSDYEKLAVECLAEGLGEEASSIDVDSDYLKKISEMYKQQYKMDEANKKDVMLYVNDIIKKKFGLNDDEIRNNRENYSAYVAQIRGVTINSPIYQTIGITNNASDIHELIFIYGHETGHSLITKHSTPIPITKDYLFNLFGGERLIISESCADIIGGWAVDAFEKNHLKDPCLIEKFRTLKEEFSSYRGDKETYKFVNNLSKLLEEGKYGEVSKIYEERENLARERGIIHNTINNATISIIQRYSGQEEINEMLKYIDRNTTKKGFLDIAAKTMSVEELKAVYEELGGKTKK